MALSCVFFHSLHKHGTGSVWRAQCRRPPPRSSGAQAPRRCTTTINRHRPADTAASSGGHPLRRASHVGRVATHCGVQAMSVVVRLAGQRRCTLAPTTSGNGPTSASAVQAPVARQRSGMARTRSMSPGRIIRLRLTRQRRRKSRSCGQQDCTRCSRHTRCVCVCVCVGCGVSVT